MLELGHSGEYLQMLASLSGTLNHFEVADFRDRALEELGVRPAEETEAVASYAAEVLQDFLLGKTAMREALSTVKDLCIAADMLQELYDFYLLFFALDDLLEIGTQHYWDGADLSNIEGIVRSRIGGFLARRSAA
ncbi:hypothetical protein HZ992_14725 [Rhizobacter sp. AJA081-3]|uniref:hypothetical protein n=1 Tax=Rhizobacter sp. AJA081-3 TaxID=2753607 RepID=UPI001AE038E9|nr:hypothetical protein [Rhizobacter sp. AJA081-3]QTN21438.1 hypothetical protein HZ992_14725 [Rhizobacter sp. AJA081-3]